MWLREGKAQRKGEGAPLVETAVDRPAFVPGKVSKYSPIAHQGARASVKVRGRALSRSRCACARQEARPAWLWAGWAFTVGTVVNDYIIRLSFGAELVCVRLQGSGMR